MMLTSAILLLAVAMLILLSKHWLRVNKRDRDAAKHQRMMSHLNWGTAKARW